MPRGTVLWLLALVLPLPLARADDSSVVFRSGISLVRIDAQVVDRDNRAITGLTARDFLLREQGRPQPIQSVDTENLPVDLLLLLDVSASMRPHVERIARASHQALHQLRDQDRVAIMVFDRLSRVPMQFRGSQSGVDRELERILDYEDFRGGTDITRALLDAGDYIGREGRHDARKAIVIVTDDETERDRNVEGVERVLARADAVLMALIAPDAMQTRGMRRDRNNYPGSGGGPLGGVIFGSPRRRGGYPGGPPAANTLSAGTEEIARASGGDSMPVTDAYALQDTLARIRNRYAIYFSLPPGVREGEDRQVELYLADAALRQYPGADMHYRHDYYAQASSPQAAPENSQPVVVSGSQPNRNNSQRSDDPGPPPLRRRGVTQVPDRPLEGPLDSGSPAAQPSSQPAPTDGAWRKAQPASPAPPPADPNAPGWRKARPDELPPK
jgi:VWFA-related protein